MIAPRMTEKAYISAQNGTYIFNVPMSANKAEVIRTVEAEYKVKVIDARLVVRTGKTVTANRGKRRAPGVAQRSDTKKAYVRLAEGQKLDLFNEAEDKAAKKETK